MMFCLHVFLFGVGSDGGGVPVELGAAMLELKIELRSSGEQLMLLIFELYLVKNFEQGPERQGWRCRRSCSYYGYYGGQVPNL